jgi:drug/metabolite transporter (DMT)-like permease
MWAFNNVAADDSPARQRHEARKLTTSYRVLLSSSGRKTLKRKIELISAQQLVPVGFSLAAVLCWGTSDFSGGYASKRSDAFIITLLSHAGGFTLMLTLALLTHAAYPSASSRNWALLAGALGGTGLAIFYRTLAAGNMGIVAPVSAVIGAAIPAGFAMITQGLPGTIAIAGFLLACIGIWLISRPEGSAYSYAGISMAALAGIGFAGFFICIDRAGNSSALWSAVHSRLASLVIVAAIVLFRRAWLPPGPGRLQPAMASLALFAGCLDATGTAVFIRAEQTGRMDTAVVLSSLYPVITVLLARAFLQERFTRWKTVGIFAALLAVPLIALQ